MKAMTDEETPAFEPSERTGRRAGYLVAGAIHVLFLWIANNLLDRGWPAFLTDDFEDLLLYVNASLVVGIVVNLVWLWRDPAWLKHLGEIVSNVFSFVAAVRTWQIFPFDFSSYSIDWDPVARVVIAVGILGVSVATIVELVKLVRLLVLPSHERGARTTMG